MEETKLSEKQISDMKHALGLRRAGDKLDGQPFRNYFNTGVKSAHWETLVDLGLATRNQKSPEMGGMYYHVTEQGINLLKRIME